MADLKRRTPRAIGGKAAIGRPAPGNTCAICAAFLEGKPAELIEKLRKLAPLERLGEPEDIARVVSFLAGPDGAWVNGQVLRANGGVV